MEQFEPDASQDNFEVEVSNIPAQGDNQSAPATPVSLKARLSPAARARRLALGGGALLLGLLVILLSLYPDALRQWFTKPSPPPLELRPQQQGLACLVDAAWSPYEQQVALLGYRNFCGEVGTPRPGLVAIYAATSGKLLRQLQPDQFILQALQQYAAQSATPTPAPPGSLAGQQPSILYQRLLWSSNGGRLALVFTVSLSPSIPPLKGLAALDQNLTSAQVWMMNPAGQDFPAAVEWDTVSGLQSLLSGPRQFFPSNLNASFSITYPPAFSYVWETNGDLTPQGLLPLAGQPPAPPGQIGDPNDTRTFSIWQAGAAELIINVDNGPLHTPGVYIWHTAIDAWSPDGRYMITDLGLGARLIGQGLPAASGQTIAALGFEHLPLVGVRDAGLMRVLQALDPWHLQASLISWRPDGRVLAAYNLSSHNPAPVMLYACATGSELASLQPPARQGAGLPGPTALLRWSPDGSRLLSFSVFAGTVAIWGPAQLPGA
jgi:hypothetical protein